MTLDTILKSFNKIYSKMEKYLAQCEKKSTELIKEQKAIHKQMDTLYHEKERTVSIMDKLAPLCGIEKEEDNGAA
jgi:hypothetical protein